MLTSSARNAVARSHLASRDILLVFLGGSSLKEARRTSGVLYKAFSDKILAVLSVSSFKEATRS